MATKTIAMGAAKTVSVSGCVVVVDGEQIDTWSSVSKTARAGYEEWMLSDEQVAALLADPAASFTRKDHPMRGFHR
jgi:hypothetical protein